MSITVDPEDNSYDMGIMKFKDEKIISEEFEYIVGGSNETRGASSSQDPIGYKGSENEYSYSASGIPMEYHDFLIRMKMTKETFPITVYAYGPDGDYGHVGTLMYCRVDEVSVSNGDEGYSLDVSGPALAFELPN